MANVLHRTTLEFRRSVNDPEYSDPPWLFHPDMSAVDGVPRKYWKLTGDVVSEMNQSEKDAVDAQALSDTRDAIAAQFDNMEDTFRAFALALLDELNLRGERFTALLDAIDNANNMAEVKTAVAAIADISPRDVDGMKTAVRNKLGS